MPLAPYHLKYLKRSDEELQRRAEVKEIELRKILDATKYKTTQSPARVAVLGCADKRFVALHKKIFEKLLNTPVALITFDVTLEHLVGVENAIQHDITIPLPNPGYDITFGHVVLKFIETEKQWLAIKNSYDALRAPGLAIHVFDEEDITTTTPKQADGHFSVPLKRWEEKLKEENIKFQELHWEVTPEEMPIFIRGVKGGALVLIK